MSAPTISVIVPTIGRESLTRAVQSAFRQSLAPLEVLVVVDAVTAAPAMRLRDDERVRLLQGPGPRRGPAAARMCGVRAAHGELVAFLDDDDVWLPDKLRRQAAEYACLSQRAPHVVVACGSLDIDDSATVRAVVPRRTPNPAEPLSHYLFHRESVRPGHTALGASILLCDRALLVVEPLDEDLVLHEDWEWILRVTRRRDVEFSMLPEPLVVYQMHGRGLSTSGASPWKASWRWAHAQRPWLTKREYGDFLLCITAPLAISQGHRIRGLWLTREALVSGRPGLPAWIFFAASLCLPARLARFITQRAGRRTGTRLALPEGAT